TIIGQGAKPGLRVLVRGNLVYSLDFQSGAMGNDSGLAISVAEGGTQPPSGFNAWGNFEWSREKEQAVFKMHDLSIFTMGSSHEELTAQEFTELLWNKIVDIVEEKYS
ncbi:MAG TPA: hypothetical protein VNA68_01855, partial [Candidatus Dormibacteraeota bacterium]|nr:hypothetical protein [Candidatus Dormibacteraeota bacterium]